MNAEASRRRIPAAILWGAFVVLVWAALTALFGGGQARADDEVPAPLSGLSSLVKGTATEVVSPVVEKAAETVDKVAAPAVKQVAAPVVRSASAVVEKAVSSVPVVGEPVAKVVETATGTVPPVVEKVADIVTDAPVAAVVTPVTDAVRELPVVGGVLDGLGVTEVVDTTAGAVDEVAGSLRPVLDATVQPVVDAVVPEASAPVPVAPGADVDPAAPNAGADAALAPASAEIAPITLVPTALAASPASSRPIVAPDRAATTTDAPVSVRTQGGPGHPGSDGFTPPLGAAAPGSSAGAGGASGSAWADANSSAHHAATAWAFTAAPVDSQLPPSPVGSTDVSPD